MKKRIRFKKRFVELLLKLSINLFMWSMKIEKRKYSIYWTGPDFKTFKYNAWLASLAALLAYKMKLGMQAACLISITRGKVGVARLDVPRWTNLQYKELCIVGAKLFQKEAKLRGEKPIKIGGKNAHSVASKK